MKNDQEINTMNEGKRLMRWVMEIVDERRENRETSNGGGARVNPNGKSDIFTG